LKPTNKPRASEHEAIEARAAAWLAELDDGLSPAEEKTFAEWRAEDPRHEAAVARLRMAWGALARLRDFRPEARQHPDPDLLAPVSQGNAVRFPLRPVLGLAAAATIAATALVYWNTAARLELPPTREMPVDSNHYATTQGGYQRATLPDGSVIELNENSEVTLAFAVSERRVQLTRGEVHFTVAKNKLRPFIVAANGVNVRAVGTAFNVKVDPQSIEVLVTEGTVSLHSSAEAPMQMEDMPLMVAGERAVVSISPEGWRPHLDRPGAEAISMALAWQNPRVVFQDATLADVVSQFNRRNEVQIRIADRELTTEPVEGNFEAENIEAFVRLMGSNTRIRVERPSPGLVILHRIP